ncbi:hypothetical protein ACSSS7_004847 [Eimeria intestinalis]
MGGPVRGPSSALSRSCSARGLRSISSQAAAIAAFANAAHSSPSKSSGTRSSNKHNSSNTISSSTSSSSSSSDSPFSLLLLQQSKVFVRRCPPRALGLRETALFAETSHTRPRGKSNRSSSSSSNSSNSSSSNSSSSTSSSSRRQQLVGVSHVSELLCRLARRQLRSSNVSACVSSIEAAAVNLGPNPQS